MSKTEVDVPLLEAAWSLELADCVAAAAWSPDGARLAVGGADGTLQILDAAGKAVATASHPGGVLSAAWSRTGAHLATGGQDGAVRLWDPATGAARRVIDLKQGWVEHLAWSPRTDVLAASAGKLVWRLDAEGTTLDTHGPHASTVAGLAWMPSTLLGGSDVLATCCYGGAWLWYPEKGKKPREYPWKGSMVALAVSPDRKHIACGCQDQSVHVWIAKDGEDMQMSGYAAKVKELSWDKAGKLLATGGGADVTVWDFGGKGPQGSTPRVCSAHEARITALAFRPTGTTLASAAQDGGVLLWDVKRPKAPRAGWRSGAAVTTLAWRPQGDLLACADERGGLAVLRPDA